MAPTPEELELGAKVYRQMRFYENVTVKDIRRTPWMYLVLAGLLVLGLTFKNHLTKFEHFLLFLVIPIFYIVQRWQFRTAKENYATHKLLLQLLEEKYGDALPWVVEEKQLASARELEAKIAQGQLPISHV